MATAPRNFSLTGFLKLVRAYNLLILAITQWSVGMVVASHTKEFWWQQAFNPQLWLLIGATVCIAAAGYIINDYYDVKIDIVNKPSRVVIDRVLKRRVAIILHLLLNLVGLALAWPLGKNIFLIVGFSGFWLWLYSNWLKRQPLLGNVVVAALSAVAVWLPAYFFREQTLLMATFAAYAFIISLIREIIKDMEDMRGDMRYGCRTLPIVWGIRRTKWVIVSLTIVFVAFLLSASSAFSEIATYYLAALVLPMAFFTRKLLAADKIRDYRFLSKFAKILMLLGILTLFFF
jgi:4-hydroxybenzoate polyprenyltransferase